MQNRYAGDVGDYVKLALLRALSPGRRIGVAWWLCPDGGPAGDGRHTAYLEAPTVWRDLDPKLFDALRHIVTSGQRNVAALEQLQLGMGCCIHQTATCEAPATLKTPSRIASRWRLSANHGLSDKRLFPPERSFGGAAATDCARWLAVGRFFSRGGDRADLYLS